MAGSNLAELESSLRRQVMDFSIGEPLAELDDREEAIWTSIEDAWNFYDEVQRHIRSGDIPANSLTKQLLAIVGYNPTPDQLIQHTIRFGGDPHHADTTFRAELKWEMPKSTPYTEIGAIELTASRSHDHTLLEIFASDPSGLGIGFANEAVRKPKVPTPIGLRMNYLHFLTSRIHRSSHLRLMEELISVADSAQESEIKRPKPEENPSPYVFL